MRSVFSFLVSLALLSLAGCAAQLRPINEFLAPDSASPEDMLRANVQGVVYQDEEYFSIHLKNGEGNAGVGSDIRKYRRAIVMVVNSNLGRPIGNIKSFRLHMLLVPDGMPMLHEGDIVEFRSVKYYDSLKDYEKSGDGNAILRLLCPVGSGSLNKSMYEQCQSKLNWYKPWGEGVRYNGGVVAVPSGRPFASSLKDHSEVHYSPYYDGSGNVLPKAVAPAPRPSLVTWITPEAGVASY